MLENLTFELPKTGFLGTDHHRMNRHLFALQSLLRYALFKEKASKFVSFNQEQRNIPSCDFEVLVSLKSCIQASSFGEIKITLIQLNTGLTLI